MGEFMTIYSIKEVADKTNIPQGTLRQWETDFQDLLKIPRDSQNARYYTEEEIAVLTHIKTMRENNLSKPVIHNLLKKWQETNTEQSPPDTSEDLQTIQTPSKTFPDVSEKIVSEIKKEIRQEIKHELVADIHQVMSRSLAEQNQHIDEQLKDVSEAYKAEISRQNDMLSEQFQALSEAYKAEVSRRDEALMENVNLMKEIRELKEEKKKPLYKKLLGK